jgi:hypothetical protein
VCEFWKIEGSIFAVSRGLKQILRIDVAEKQVKDYYKLSVDEDEVISKSVYVEDSIYCVGSATQLIYRFDVKTKMLKTYKVSNPHGSFLGLCFVDDKFWLYDARGELYICNRDFDIVDVIDALPQSDKNNSLDTRAYENVIYIGQRVWLIPFQTDTIFFVDKNTHEMQSFEIEGEASDSSKPKYNVLYTIDNRYIGLFSIRIEAVIEIDTVEMKVQRKRFFYGAQCKKDFETIHGGNGNIYREDLLDKLAYESAIWNKDAPETKGGVRSIGEDIYNKMMN